MTVTCARKFRGGLVPPFVTNEAHDTASVDAVAQFFDPFRYLSTRPTLPKHISSEVFSP